MPPDARQRMVEKFAAPRKPKTVFGPRGAQAHAYLIPGLGEAGREQNTRNFRRYFDQMDAYHDRATNSRQPSTPHQATQTLPYRGMARGWRGPSANTAPPPRRPRKA